MELRGVHISHPQGRDLLRHGSGGHGEGYALPPLCHKKEETQFQGSLRMEEVVPLWENDIHVKRFAVE